MVTTNRDPEGRKTVFDVLPADLPRLMTIGRLDINTEGLLLLTNDGGLARVLELPATGWLRRYRVRVHGKVEEKALAGLRDGIAVDGVFYGSIEATLDREQGTNAWLTLGLREGKNREVRNILGALGLDVTQLIRISYGPFQLNELPEGHVQEIKGRMLREQLGERLVEESGANFDAEITKPFSNKPTRRTEPPREEEARPKPAGRDIDRRPIEPPGQRKANVWMAPGARPIGKGRAEADAARAAETKARKASFKPGGKPAGARPFGKSRDDRADRGGKDGERPRGGPKGPRGGNADRRR